MANKSIEQDCKAVQMFSLLLEELHSIKMLLLKEATTSAPQESASTLYRVRDKGTDECWAGEGKIPRPSVDIADGTQLVGSYMTVKEVAALLRVSIRHVHRLATQNEIPSIRLGTTLRIDRNALINWIQIQSQKTKS